MSEQENTIIVKPAIYIDVLIQGRKQIYDVETAQTLVRELTRALNQFDQLQSQGSENAQTEGQTVQSLSRDRPYDPVRQSGDESRLAVDGVRNRGA